MYIVDMYTISGFIQYLQCISFMVRTIIGANILVFCVQLPIKIL